MVNENIIPKTETVYELKENTYEIKTSELSPAARSKIIKMYGGNYQSPLINKDISEIKGYGPSSRTVLCHMQYSLRLRIECHSWLGDGESVEVDGVDEAERQVKRLRNRSWNNSWAISNDVLDKCAFLVLDAVIESTNRPVNGYIKVRGTFGGWEANCKY